MGNIGSTLVLFGVGSIALNLFDYEFALMSWVDNWGPGVGWAIRIAMIVVGGALFLLDNSEEAGEEEQA